jgi:hypothetical protein
MSKCSDRAEVSLQNMSNMSKSKIASKRHAPPGLQGLIELANSVPPELDLPFLDLPFPEGRTEEILALLRTDACSRFRDLTGPVEPDTFLTKFIGPEARKTYQKVMGNYLRLRDARNWLRKLAQSGTSTMNVRFVMPHASVRVNERGQAEFNIDHLVKVLDGVEVSKIRVCPICGVIFWAPRKDAPCCSIRCGKVQRTRRYRAKYLEQYKLQRVTRAQVSSDAERKAQLAKEVREREELMSLKAPDSKRRAARIPPSEKHPAILNACRQAGRKTRR